MKTLRDPEARVRDLPMLDDPPRPSVADKVFVALQHHILTLALPPGSKMSEVEVADQMGVSRQPVRDAFYRLSKLGFLNMRPQRATTVSLISEESVMRAKFIRTAMEMETCRTAATTLGPDDIAALQDLLDAQADAIARQAKEEFHTLDDAFHRTICERAGLSYVWDLIHESKAHMDRVRMLTLNSQSQHLAYTEHIALLQAIGQRDGDAAAQIVRTHLSRIQSLIHQMQAENHSWFTEDAP
jgi:DNA-binding GntR family transcriptional regulator